MGTLYTPPHPTPKLPDHGPAINPPPASSTSLFKWEIMQMSSHHSGTPHISDVHSLKSIVCLRAHAWESAHECSNSPRDGCGLNKHWASQVSRHATLSFPRHPQAAHSSHSGPFSICLKLKCALGVCDNAAESISVALRARLRTCWREENGSEK